MWKTIRIRTAAKWRKVEAMVSGIWAAHRSIGLPTDQDADWVVTHVPTGLNALGLFGPLTPREAMGVSAALAGHVRQRKFSEIAKYKWPIEAIGARAIADAEAV